MVRRTREVTHILHRAIVPVGKGKADRRNVEIGILGEMKTSLDFQMPNMENVEFLLEFLQHP